MTKVVAERIYLGRLFKDGWYGEERRWVPAEDYEREIERLEADISQAYDLRDKAEGRYCTALGEIEKLRAALQEIADSGECPELPQMARTALGDALEPPAVTCCSGYVENGRTWHDPNCLTNREPASREASSARCPFVGMYDVHCGLNAGHEGEHKIYGSHGPSVKSGEQHEA